MRRLGLVLAAFSFLWAALFGAWALTPAQQTVLFSSSGGNSAQVQQFFDRLATLPAPARQQLYANLINGLVADGSWNFIDDLKILAAANSATALTNLKSSSYPGTLITTGGTPVFTVDRGYLGNGINDNVDTGFKPASGVNYVQNAAFIGAWSLTSSLINSAIVVLSDNSNVVEIWPKASDNKFYISVNGSGTDTGVTNTGDSTGWYFAHRTASNIVNGYRNDVLVTPSAVVSAAPSALDTYTALKHQTAAWVAGGGVNFTASQRTSVFNRISTYLSAVGAQ